MGMTLQDLARSLGLDLHGQPDLMVHVVADLVGAQPGSLAFFADPKYRDDLKVTGATAVILKAAHLHDCPVAALVAADSAPGLRTCRAAPASGTYRGGRLPSQRRHRRGRPR